MLVRLALQFFIYCIGGGIAALTNWGITFVLTEYASIWYLYSYVIGYGLSMMVNFSFQRKVTFAVADGVASRLQKFAIVMIATSVLNVGLVYLLTDYFQLWYMASVIVVTFAVAVVNYAANRLWTFKL